MSTRRRSESAPEQASAAENGVSRRRILGVGAGAAATAALPAGAAGAVAQPRATAALPGGWQPNFFTRPQAHLVATLSDLILPRTDTPSATEAGVHEYLDESLSVAPSDERLEFLGGLTWLDQFAETTHQAPFAELEEAQQIALLQRLSAAATEAEVPASELAVGAAFFGDLRNRVLFGYYTSKIGRTEALDLPDKVQREEWKGCQHGGHG